MDDYRIFAKTRTEALKHVEILTTALAEEGLSLNSKKTELFRIVDAEEIVFFTNRFAGGEHEKIDLEEKVEVRRAVRVSGRSAIARFYREPGKDALKKIREIPKDKIISLVKSCKGSEFEQQVKLAVKYFIYVDQDVALLSLLLERKITTVFYISDALVKESALFDASKRDEIKRALFEDIDWSESAYPLQVPILRIAADPAFSEPKFVRSIVDGQMQSDSMLFFREAISLGYPCLDRARLRRLALETFQNVPDYVRRAIYCAVNRHQSLSDDEKRPLLRNMKQYADDWFVKLI